MRVVSGNEMHLGYIGTFERKKSKIPSVIQNSGEKKNGGQYWVPL